jgi:hypothetical protein
MSLATILLDGENENAVENLDQLGNFGNGGFCPFSNRLLAEQVERLSKKE